MKKEKLDNIVSYVSVISGIVYSVIWIFVVMDATSHHWCLKGEVCEIYYPHIFKIEVQYTLILSIVGIILIYYLSKK